MPHLREQLVAALGPAYRVERELGGGGMSRVFVAEEVALGRRVVVKVLAPELAAGVSGERFRREVHLAARLQHPHIVPLLAAGQSADLLYYVMPFVDGESLRQRLARETELPVAEAVRLVREIADALSHAHAHGIAHRDIKPENVLLSNRHAVVADFGIAKAIEHGQAPERAGGPTLTSVGFTIGTPAYMAPEQALADPTSDHRADLYSLGVVAYEMIAGRPPFRGTSSQELIAAHVATVPEPLTAYRPACPPAVAAVIMRCLQKRPADRPQSAEELLRALDAEATSPAGTTVANPVAAPPERATNRTLILRLAAAIAVLAALFGVLQAAGVLGTRSLVAEGMLAERERVIIADFENRTGDSTLGLAVTEAFRVDLTQSPLMRPLTPEQVEDVLQRMRRDSVSVLDYELSREIAAREGIRAVVAGEVGSIGGGYVVAARLVETASGNVLAAFRESAAGPGDIIQAVDRVSKRLRGRIGESLRATRAAPPLEQVTTGSLEALRAFSQALQATRRGERDRNVALLEEAIRLDSTFASAHRALGIALANSGENSRRRIQALATAYRLRDRLTERERLLAEASYFSLLGESDREVVAYQRMLDRNPDDFAALNNLALVHHFHGDVARALPLYRRAVAAEPSSTGFGNLVEALSELGDSLAADSVLRAWSATYPGDIGLPVYRALMASSRGQYDTAAALFERLRSERAESRMVRRRTAESLASLARVRGRLGEARRHAITATREQHPELPAAGVTEAVTAFERGMDDILLLEQPARGVERLRGVLESPSLTALDPIDRPYLVAAYLYARAGRADLPRHMVAERTRALEIDSVYGVLVPSREEHRYRKSIEGVTAAAERRYDDALALLRESGDTSRQAPWALPDIGRVHDQAGRPDSARVFYERYLGATSFYRADLDANELARVLFRLGEIYESQGDRARASERYGQFVDLWKDADPELQPRVREAKRRLATLAAEPGAL